MNKNTQSPKPVRSVPPLRVGFVPLTDCAPLVMAKELGLFLKYGLRVELRRELGWASIRDKIIYREIEAAHAVAGMPFAATLGLGSIPCDCLSALVLNLHGNAITFSNRLWKAGVRDAFSLRAEIARLGSAQTLTFGTVYPFSSHHFLLRSWLLGARINPDRDVRIVTVPPPQMVSNLKAGHLDGFCVGEPWNSLAVQSGAGVCVATSAELAPGHPEKVLMVRHDFAQKRSSEHLSLLRAVLEACLFCQDPVNHEQVISTLARPEYVGVSDRVLRSGIRGELEFGQAGPRPVLDFNIFHSHDANEPTPDKASWVLLHLRDLGLVKDPSVFNAAFGRQIFRADIYRQLILHEPSSALIPNRNDEKTSHAKLAQV